METNIFYDINNRTIESGKNVIYDGQLYIVLEDKEVGLIIHPVLGNTIGEDIPVSKIYNQIQLL